MGGMCVHICGGVTITIHTKKRCRNLHLREIIPPLAANPLNLLVWFVVFLLLYGRLGVIIWCLDSRRTESHSFNGWISAATRSRGFSCLFTPTEPILRWNLMSFSLFFVPKYTEETIIPWHWHRLADYSCRHLSLLSPFTFTHSRRCLSLHYIINQCLFSSSLFTLIISFLSRLCGVIIHVPDWLSCVCRCDLIRQSL